MAHNLDLIFTLTGGLTAALIMGMITQKLKLSPVVGYLLAGVVVGHLSPAGSAGLGRQDWFSPSLFPSPAR